MASSRISTVLQSLLDLPDPIRVSGASPSAQALIVARLALTKRPLVVLCPDDELAQTFSADLELFLDLNSVAPIRVYCFATWEQSPFSPIAPSIKTRLSRLQTLSALAHDAENSVIVCSMASLCQATLPVALFTEFTLKIKRDDSVESREELMRRLLESGYMRIDPVEDPGTFAVRGDIVDVFPTNRAKPLRIELFGDVVEKIREFEPSSQRATPDGPEALTEVFICPAREVLINSKTAGYLREQIKAKADDLGISRAARDPILSSIQAGIYPEHADAWAPFAYAKPETLWDYLPEATTVIWSDELSCEQAWDRFIEDQTDLAKAALESELIVPEVDKLFSWGAALDQRIEKKSRLYLDRLELIQAGDFEKSMTEDREVPMEGSAPDAISPKHKVSVRPNTDLAQGSRHSLEELEPKFNLWKRQGFGVLILASTQSQVERIKFLLQERSLFSQAGNAPQPSLITLKIGALSQGFRWPAEGLVVLTESEVLGAKHVKKSKKPASESGSAAKNWAGLQALADLAVGDAVVHIDHGIGRYQGIARLDLSGAPSDFLILEYANKDKLYLPVYRLNVIQKYVASGESVTLDRLGSQNFAKAKEKVREGVKELAIDLVQLYAERKIREGVRFSPRDAVFQEFESKFPFEETPDQSRAIDEILHHMETGQVMDRLVCGDVGYGKTEVAMRAAFRAVSDGKQVAVLVPTTVLAYQHEQSFKARCKDYPFVIDSVSRFKSAKEQKVVLEATREGRVDILIGTHRLLSKDVQFKDLGLIIVDEEHRFGVEHKERLKTLKLNTHVLTLTATPIPRTLHMALAGLRDISLINTPPVDRLPIRTYVSRFDDSLIERAVTFEINRGGQVFFLHNRVQSIFEMANRIQKLVPNAQVGVAHGQMSETELEKAMMNFYQKKSNVLVCTTIIESGLDLPSANTILINRADSLGLAQLYQIRGRVGRGQNRAYAYLLIPEAGAVTEDAKKRLEVIQRFVELGSGFSIASHDLEIRGGGDLLGPQQSGHIAAVGFDLYTELLEEAIREIEGRGGDLEESMIEPEIKAPFSAFLSEPYVPDMHQRLSLYRRFSSAKQDQEIDALEEELRDRFGPLPAEAQNLLWLIRLKIILKQLRIQTLTVGPEKVSLLPAPHSRLDPARAIALVSAHPHQYQLMPDSKFVAKVNTSTLRDLYFSMESLFKGLLAS